MLSLITTTFLPSIPVLASAWTEEADNSSIYGGSTIITEALEEEEPNVLEKLILPLFISIGKGCENLFRVAGISLDHIVYGRVNGNARNGVALFTFELNNGNPYGLVGAAIYQVFRMISYAVIIVIVVGKLSFHTYRKMTPQMIEQTKSSLLHFVVSFLLLALMPYVLDVVLYLRDVILYFVTNATDSFLFSTSVEFSLTELFRENASNSLTSASIYIASVFYSLYLAFMYIGYALSFLICFAAFPLVVIASHLKKELLQNWVSTVAYYIFIPVLDATLLLVPIFMVHYGIAPLITLLACMSIISARSIFAQLLGIQDRGSGFMGMAAMLATGKMINTMIGTGKTALGMFQGAKQDKTLASYEEAMATATGISSGTITPMGNSAFLSADMAGIADKYATVNDLEATPLTHQMSHAKKAELYRQRSKERKQKAVSTLLGGMAGGFIGGSAGIMMGPAITAMGVSAGTTAGAGIASGIGTVFSNLSFGKKLNRDFNDIENVTGTIDDSLPVPISTNTFVSTDMMGNADFENTGISKEDIATHINLNSTAIQECSTYLQGHYIDNGQELMQPIYQEMKTRGEFQHLSQEDAREKFRDRVHKQYMEEFNQLYYNHSDCVVSNHKFLESVAEKARAQAIRKHIFDKDNQASFVSNEALDQYDWFEL